MTATIIKNPSFVYNYNILDAGFAVRKKKQTTFWLV